MHAASELGKPKLIELLSSYLGTRVLRVPRSLSLLVLQTALRHVYVPEFAIGWRVGALGVVWTVVEWGTGSVEVRTHRLYLVLWKMSTETVLYLNHYQTKN